MWDTLSDQSLKRILVAYCFCAWNERSFNIGDDVRIIWAGSSLRENMQRPRGSWLYIFRFALALASASFTGAHSYAKISWATKRFLCHKLCKKTLLDENIAKVSCGDVVGKELALSNWSVATVADHAHTFNLNDFWLWFKCFSGFLFPMPFSFLRPSYLPSLSFPLPLHSIKHNICLPFPHSPRFLPKINFGKGGDVDYKLIIRERVRTKSHFTNKLNL